MRRVFKAIAQALLWPFTRFFDPRFRGIHDAMTTSRETSDALHRDSMLAQQQTHGEVSQLHWLIRADMDATSEAMTLIGRSLRDLEVMTEEAWRGSRTYLEHASEGFIEELDEPVARLLNYANSHRGFAAQGALWFNPPVVVKYSEHGAGVGHVNERIAEVPFVFRTLARVPLGAQVLDVGASESTLCLSLATFGYRVTAIDPRPNPLSHPNLDVVAGKIEDWDAPGSFQATVCLSTIEHVGVGVYGQDGEEDRADLRAMQRIRDVTEPGGLLVLTTSYGPSRVGERSRTYDRRGLDELLEGWQVDELSLLVREDETTWLPLDAATEPAELENREAVAMIAATRRP
jgi:2-polyprenyl-3-methyl-5-hydroxy-6-metoxy-1,4-benzoquinol methylase